MIAIDNIRQILWTNRSLHALYGKLLWYTTKQGLRQLSKELGFTGWSVQCPFCGWRSREFLPHPPPHERPNTLCYRCYSKERHRLLWLYLYRELEIDKRPLQVLEIAPEPYSLRLFHSLAHIRYMALDLESRLANTCDDITDLPIASRSQDLVSCYHVLEHVPNDRRAMSELRRVLAPDGVLLVQVPMKGAVTDEDPTVTDPLERLHRYMQQDHVRQYGFDFIDRLHDAGLHPQVDRFAARLDRTEVAHYGLDPSELIIRC